MSSTSSTTSSGKPRGAAARADIGRAVAARLMDDPAVLALPHDGITLFAVPDFLSAPECAELIARIDAASAPSTLYTSNPVDVASARTSDSANVDRFDPFIAGIDARVLDLTGLDERQGETIQGQRYRPGQKFSPHHDWFAEDEPHWLAEAPNGGQRTWTAMAYLNRPEAGGATNFPLAGFAVEPRPGLLILWNNMGVDGTPNPLSLHEGVIVTAGVKYIFTKWFREADWY